MKILSKIKGMLIGTMALGLIFTIGTKNIYATENEITSGIYQVENDVYHESEIGMSMSRTYLLPTMNVEVTRDHIIYTVGFAGSEFMENYRMKVNGQEAPVEMVEENSEDGTVKLKVAVDKDTPYVSAKIAKTIDAAPLIPTHDINICCFIGTLNQYNILNIDIGLATKIINNDINIPFSITNGILDGNANNPKTKNKVICISHDIPSKNWNILFLCGIFEFPIIIPVI